MEKQKQTINEVVDINGSKVFVEDGEVKTIFSEEIQRTGYMNVEEARSLSHAYIDRLCEIYNIK